MEKKIAIIGAGFMGGSLALILKEKFPQFSVWAYARSESSYLRINKTGIFHKVERDLNKLISGADFVALALPITIIIKYLKEIAPYLKKGAVVFDLGSSKELIRKKALEYLPKTADFVGCHPLCGGEKSGIEFSRRDLYQDELCLITFSSCPKGMKAVKELWEKAGSRVEVVSSLRHDKMLSSLSHLPHLISFSLTKFISKAYLKFSPQSVKDLTRISNSPPEVWADIFISNQDNLLKDLDGFIKVLRNFEQILKTGNRNKIIALIKKINEKQKLINGDRK